jgi:serine/threonine protein kinase
VQHIRKGIDDAVQHQFAEVSLHSLMERHAATSLTPITYHDWAVSSLEIFQEEEVLGEGSFGTVYTGRWHGCRVAVKRLAPSVSRQVSYNPSAVWI